MAVHSKRIIFAIIKTHAMFPIKSNLPRRSFPVINYSLIILNILIFIWQLYNRDQLQEIIYTLAVIPADFTAMTIPLPEMAYRTLASMFLHGGILHVFMNMWFLLVFGSNIEDGMGHIRYAFFYLLGGFASTLLHIVIYSNSEIPVVGASGAIAAVMGAYFVLYPLSTIVTLVPIFFFFLPFNIPAFIFLFVWFIMQFWMGTITLFVGMTNIAFWAHIGGFLFGTLLGRFFRKYRPRSFI